MVPPVCTEPGCVVLRARAATKKALTYFLGDTAQGQLAGLGYAPLPSLMLSWATARLSTLG